MRIAFGGLVRGAVALCMLGIPACSSDQSGGRNGDAGSGGATSTETGGVAGSGAGRGAGGNGAAESGGTAGSGGRTEMGGTGGRNEAGGDAGGERKDSGSPDSGDDGRAPGAYECIGGEVARYPVDAGQDASPVDTASLVRVPWTQAVGTCDAGTTYCSIQSLQLAPNAVPTRTCEAVPSACKHTPSCACLCSHGLPCQYVNCSCKDDADGRAIWACEQI